MLIDNKQTKYKHNIRKLDINCFILHNTGSVNADKVDKYYIENSEGVCPHFLILRSGRINQYVDLDKTAYHVGFSDTQKKLYSRGKDVWPLFWNNTTLPCPYVGYDQWFARWPQLQSPLELPSSDRPNSRSIGIELLSEGGDCTDEQYEALQELILKTSEDIQLDINSNNVYGHYDANPIARVNKYGSTDPGKGFDWDRVYKSLT